MSVITRVGFSHPDMALAHTIRSVDGLRVRVVPEAGTDPEHDVSFFLLEDGDMTDVRAALEADHTVVDNYHTSGYGEQWIFGIQFTPETQLLAPQVTARGGLVLEAKTGPDGWIERWQLPDREALHAIWDHARDASFRFDIRDLYRSNDAAFGEPFGLTPHQRETLLEAYRRGYFHEPREVSLDAIAADLDISTSAASGRIRRGLEALIESTLDDGTLGEREPGEAQ